MSRLTTGTDRLARKVFIAGGTSGIGRATAERLVRIGWTVVIGGRDLERGHEVVADIRETQPDASVHAVTVDTSSDRSVTDAMTETISQLGALDAVVNCVGTAPSGTFDTVEADGWIAALDSKTVGAVRVMQAALPYLRQSSAGRIVNLAGTAGKEPEATMAVAAAANGAMLAMTRAAATQLATEGITVNAVAPGPTQTRRWDSLVATSAERDGITVAQADKRVRSTMPTGRPTLPDEVAALVGFLLSSENGHIMGAVIPVDGGQSKGF